MSKYTKLWEYIADCGEEHITLSFDKIGELAGVAIDHSFLKYKKELTDYGYKVNRISMKEQNVTFEKCPMK